MEKTQNQQEKCYYVYMLRCTDGSLYTGITTDMERRLAEHTDGGKKGAKYTKNHTPEAVAALWRVENRSMALKSEWYIKHLTRQKKQMLCEMPEQLSAWSGIKAEVIELHPASGTFSA
ncbi:MAG: GIY-YIG nuclease family protein [Lachnospiraceae bacterium]|nr:GIY-YIG nuclease family protein [Lachnospiraceae bacterium]